MGHKRVLDDLAIGRPLCPAYFKVELFQLSWWLWQCGPLRLWIGLRRMSICDRACNHVPTVCLRVHWICNFCIISEISLIVKVPRGALSLVDDRVWYSK